MGARTKAKVIKNISQYIKWVDKLGDGEFLYRGQASQDWPLRSGATRRICGETEEDKIHYARVEDYIEELIRTVREKELDKHNQRYDLDCDLKILAQLQHYGAATPLLDFSKNSLIALWMACSDEDEKHGKVFAIKTNQPNINRVITCQPTENDDKTGDNSRVKDIDPPLTICSNFLDFLKENKDDALKSKNSYWIWEPSHFNERIPAQSSVFFFGKEEYEIQHEHAIIDKDRKKDILKQLEKIHGLKEYNIYPDFAGFAQANGAEKAYPEKDARYYLDLAIKSSQEQNFKAAIKEYNHALRLNRTPKDTKIAIDIYMGLANCHFELESFKDVVESLDEAEKASAKPDFLLYFRRGYAKNELDDTKGAMEDYNEAIKLNPNNTGIYNNRGNIKINSGDNEGAMEDYNEAIKLDQNFIYAYNGRGNVKINLGDNERAIEDYNEAIKLDQNFIYAYNGRGEAYTKLKEFQKAREDLLKAKELAEEQNNTGQLKRCELLLKELEKAEQAN